MIPEVLVWALENFPASFIEIKTDHAEQVKDEFLELFHTHWNQAVKNVETDTNIPRATNPGYYPYTAEELFPAKCETKEDLITVILDPMTIPYCFGEFCDTCEACGALDQTIQELQSRYPTAMISGYIAFPWSDRRCGDVIQYAIGKEQDRYPVLGEILNAAIEGKSLFHDIIEKPGDCYSFADKLQEELEENDGFEEFEKLIKFIDHYQNLISRKTKTTLIKIMKLAAESIGEDTILDLFHPEKKSVNTDDKEHPDNFKNISFAQLPIGWISCKERLPDEMISPMTWDFLEYPCIYQSADGEREVRFYKFGHGHFWLGAGIMDEHVIAWHERPAI